MNRKYNRKATEHYEYPQICLVDDGSFQYTDMQLFTGTKKDVAIYIHIPFCKNNCIFCNYYKLHKFDETMIKIYFEMLKKELTTYKPCIAKVKAIQFGGGTPTCVSMKYYNDLLFFIKTEFECESTLQISMESNIRQLLQGDTVGLLTEYGINRVSFGVQTFNNRTRHVLGLTYGRDDLFEKINLIINNSHLDCNVDLMYNLPYHEPQDLLEDINNCFELGINCIDLYHLNVFPGTRMYKWMHEKEFLKEYYSKSRQKDYYQVYQKLIDDEGINFCMSNTISKKQKQPNIHINMQLGGMDCWQLGIGASARGFVSDTGYRNYVELKDYIEAVSITGYGIRTAKKCEDLIRRKLVLGTNLLKIDIAGLILELPILNVIEKLITENIFMRQGNFIILNPKYYFYAGNVSEEFYTIEDMKQAQEVVLSNYKNKLNMYNQDKMNIT